MTPFPHSNPSDICRGILQYLHDHPEAADSLDGIASWWLPQSGQSVTLESVQAALAQLVAEHRIARIDLADGRTLFQSIDKVSGSHPAWKPPSPRRRP
jgi:Fe2+ or Zn2+ uptake regulation protein